MSGKCRPSLRQKTLDNVRLSNLSQTDKECIEAAFSCLATYEDTNLEPEDIKELLTEEVATVARAFLQIAKNGELETLQWLLIAKKEGRLVVLPPKESGIPLQ